MYGTSPTTGVAGDGGLTGVSGFGSGLHGQGVHGEGGRDGVGVFGLGATGVKGSSQRIGVFGNSNPANVQITGNDFIDQHALRGNVGVLANGPAGVVAAGTDPSTGVAVRARAGHTNVAADTKAIWAENVGIGKRDFAVHASVDPNSSALAGLFEGNVEIKGSLKKSGGGFKIDHPEDPASKFLNHSFVESSERKNVYDGAVRLDQNGGATVRVPRWFGLLNRDLRYQLTAVGAPAPNLHVAQEMLDGAFEIAGGHPGGKVCWQVTGNRQDPWAEANTLIVEEDKAPDEVGLYLSPQLFGYAEEKSLYGSRTFDQPRQADAASSDIDDQQ